MAERGNRKGEWGDRAGGANEGHQRGTRGVYRKYLT